MEWRNQVAVVTGGARGLGRATARLLAQRGAAVCVNYAVHADAAGAMVAQIATSGGRAIAVAADVADSAAVEAMVAHTEAELGPYKKRAARYGADYCDMGLWTICKRNGRRDVGQLFHGRPN
jgi:NAD(P)-dependent dehydrogenase (short-subunit alcohol dehydrogenase family)